MSDAQQVSPRLRVLDSISGQSLVAIQTALPELAKHGLDFRKFRITVSTLGRKTNVEFTDPARELNGNKQWFGNVPGLLKSFAVELSDNGNTVVRSYFER